MDFSSRAAEKNGFYFQAKYRLMVKKRKYALKNSESAPAVHACVNAVPASEILQQASPFTSILRNIKKRFQYPEVVKMNSISPARQAAGNSLILPASNLQTLFLQNARCLAMSLNSAAPLTKTDNNESIYRTKLWWYTFCN